MFSILDDDNTTVAQVEAAVDKGLIHPAAAAEWRLNRMMGPLLDPPKTWVWVARIWAWFHRT